MLTYACVLAAVVWVGSGPGSDGVEGCYVCVRYESGLYVYMAGPGIRVLCLADTCASEVYPVFYSVTPYGYLLPNMYLFKTDIANPDSFVCCCRTWIRLDINRFCAAAHGRFAQKNGKSFPHCWGREGSTQFAQQFVTPVTTPPLVDCVVWSRLVHLRLIILPRDS